jgi:hypothetical protein
MKVHIVSIAIVAISASYTISLNANLKSIKCSSSNITIYPNYTCFLKAFKRNVAALTILTFIRKNTFKCNIDTIASFKQKTSAYYRTITNATSDFCSFMSGNDINPVLKLIYDVIIDQFPKEMNHPCPFVVRLNSSVIIHRH